MDERSIITRASPLSFAAHSLSFSVLLASSLVRTFPRPSSHSCPLHEPPVLLSFLLLHHDEMQGHAAPLLASKTVLDPRATLHTIRERHGEAPLLFRLSLLFSTWSPLTSRGALLDRGERRHEERLKLVPQCRYLAWSLNVFNLSKPFFERLLKRSLEKRTLFA